MMILHHDGRLGTSNSTNAVEQIVLDVVVQTGWRRVQGELIPWRRLGDRLRAASFGFDERWLTR